MSFFRSEFSWVGNQCEEFSHVNRVVIRGVLAQHSKMGWEIAGD